MLKAPVRIHSMVLSSIRTSIADTHRRDSKTVNSVSMPHIGTAEQSYEISLVQLVEAGFWIECHPGRLV